jgi:hypothetical protein
METVSTNGTFQGFIRNSARVRIYTLDADAGGTPFEQAASDFFDQEEIVLEPQSRADRTQPVLTKVLVANRVGSTGGAFQLTAKATRRAAQDFMSIVHDDDWVDIELFMHDKPFHVMRGRIDSVVLRHTATSSGATTVTIDIYGRAFGSIFELSPIYFDPFTDGVLAAQGYAAVLQGDDRIPTSVSETVGKLLTAFLSAAAELGRANWQVPNSMKSARLNGIGDSPLSFIDHLRFSPDGTASRAWIRDDPPRQHVNSLTFSGPGPDRVFWELLQTWADLALCDFYCDLLHPEDRYFKNMESVRAGDSRMALILRDKPFPTYSRRSEPGVLEAIDSGPWFEQLTEYEVPERQVRGKRVARSGAARRNAFYVTPLLTQSLGAALRGFQQPLWNPQSMQAHGVRRHVVQTMYVPTTLDGSNSDFLGVSARYRERIRDWLCLNHLFLTGTVDLILRPDIRVGQKLHIHGPSPAQDEWYYVDGVTHSWSETQTATSVTVSRGWVGPELAAGGETFISRLNTELDRYELGKPVEFGGVTGDAPVVAQPVVGSRLTTGVRYAKGAAIRALLDEAAKLSKWGRELTDHELTLMENIIYGVPATATAAKVPGESDGWIGRPNYKYPNKVWKISNVTLWPTVWAQLDAKAADPSASVNNFGISKRTAKEKTETLANGKVRAWTEYSDPSHAIGIGQLQPSNIDTYMPGKTRVERFAGVGNPVAETIGMLNYIYAVYDKSFEKAWATKRKPKYTY